MDFSKLPKLSQSQSNDPDAASPGAGGLPGADAGGVVCWQCHGLVPADQRFCGKCGADTRRPAARVAGDPTGIGRDDRGLSPPPPGFIVVEAWFFLIVGFVFLWLGSTFVHYEWARIHHQPFHTHVNWNDDDPIHHGSEVNYPELSSLQIWTDSAETVFGAALVINGIAYLLSLIDLPALRLGARCAALIVMVAALGYNIASAAAYRRVGMPLFQLLMIAVSGYVIFDIITLMPAGGARRTGSG